MEITGVNLHGIYAMCQSDAYDIYIYNFFITETVLTSDFLKKKSYTLCSYALVWGVGFLGFPLS